MTNLPLARSADIVLQETDQELLVYDLRINKAFCLNETAAIVFNACDGKTTFNDLKNTYPQFTDDAINAAINELSRENLLASKFEPQSSRRELLRKAALAAAALPVITVITIPASAQAQSCLGVNAACNGGGCCSSLTCSGAVCCVPDGALCTLGNFNNCCGRGCYFATGDPQNGECFTP